MKKMMLTVFLSLMTFSLVMGQDLNTLLDRAENLPRPVASEGKMQMIIVNKAGQERVRTITSYGKNEQDGTDKQMLVFLTPADVRGTRFLTITYDDPAVKDEQYIYIPAMRKVRAIGTSGGDSKTGAFLGSDFTFADIIPFERVDFDVALLGEDQIDGQKYYMVEYRAKNDGVVEKYGYSKVVRWINAEHATSRKTEYYDSSGVFVKRLFVLGQKKIDGYWRFERMEMHNLETGGKTIWQVDDYKMLSSINDKYFTLRFLQRGR